MNIAVERTYGVSVLLAHRYYVCSGCLMTLIVSPVHWKQLELMFPFNIFRVGSDSVITFRFVALRETVIFVKQFGLVCIPIAVASTCAFQFGWIFDFIPCHRYYSDTEKFFFSIMFSKVIWFLSFDDFSAF